MMEVKFVIPHRNFPSQKNSQVVFHKGKKGKQVGFAKNSRFLSFQKCLKSHLFWQSRKYGTLFPIQKSVLKKTEIHCYYPNDIRRDIHGFVEGVFDTMVHLDLLQDDNARVTGREELIPHFPEECENFTGTIVILHL